MKGCAEPDADDKKKMGKKPMAGKNPFASKPPSVKK